MRVYVRLELNDDKFNKLLEKVNQLIEELEDIPPKVIIHEGIEETDRIDIYPEILKVTDERDRGGKLILEGQVYPRGKSFEIAIEP